LSESQEEQPTGQQKFEANWKGEKQPWQVVNDVQLEHRSLQGLHFPFSRYLPREQPQRLFMQELQDESQFEQVWPL